MPNPIDTARAQANAAPTLAAPASSPATQQIVPAQCPHELAQSELMNSPFDYSGAPLVTVGASGASFAEKLEDIGFALGTRLREPGMGTTEGRAERPRARSMLRQLIKQIGAVSAAELHDLRQRVPGIDELDDPTDAMRDADFNDGEIALLLGAMLEEGKLSSNRRKRVEDALEAILESDEWALQLFSRLEFGHAGRTGLTELRQLYQRATAQRKLLTAWFEEFRRLRDRTRKLKTLIRALAFELSAQGPAMDVHLAAVVTDLKRILKFLGLEDHCQRAARELNASGMGGDVLMRTLLECVEQTWISADWLAQRTDSAILDDALRYRYAKSMMELVKLLPDDCFDDADQRDTILGAFAEHLEALSDTGL